MGKRDGNDDRDRKERRYIWPRAAGRYRKLTEQSAGAHAELVRETLLRVRALRSERRNDEELRAALTEIESDLGVAALALEEIRRWMQEAKQAAKEAAEKEAAEKDVEEPT